MFNICVYVLFSTSREQTFSITVWLVLMWKVAVTINGYYLYSKKLLLGELLNSENLSVTTCYHHWPSSTIIHRQQTVGALGPVRMWQDLVTAPVIHQEQQRRGGNNSNPNSTHLEAPVPRCAGFAGWASCLAPLAVPLVIIEKNRWETTWNN